jgi:8-oxo-dGTP diphosphatase
MNEQPYDIYKASGIIVKDREVLATRSKGKTFYIQPGGKLEDNETETQAVVRELREEMGIEVDEASLEKIGDYYADAAGQTGKRLKLAAYLVKDFTGEPSPHSEVEEIRAFSSQIPEGVEVASILEHDIIPELKSRNMID